LRRLLGVIVCLSPVALATISLFLQSRKASLVVLVMLLPALWLAVVNSHLAFIRPWRHKQRFGDFVSYRHVSVIPVIGNVLVVLAMLQAMGSRSVAVVGLILLVLDAGGLPWFLVFTWRDRSLWNPAA
jgi:hypothetical protein